MERQSAKHEDPTLATVDDEPWNKTPRELRAESLAERRIRHGEESDRRWWEQVRAGKTPFTSHC